MCVFGAGGPVGAAAAAALRRDYSLRLTDVRPVEEILARGEPQDVGAPLPEVPRAPHEWRVVDISDYAQVLTAARGADALVNCAVVRDRVAGAFRVNVVGAYNVMKAAVACGIRRVIHTGPRRPSSGFEGDHWGQFDVPDDIPYHVGSHLYGTTKHLADQVVRAFAERHGLEVICFLYGWLLPSEGGVFEGTRRVHPAAVSWEDAGEAFVCGLRAAALERPYEVFNIVAGLPHGMYRPDRAMRMLGWRPRHGFAHLYRE